MANIAVTQDTTASQENEKENTGIHDLFQAISVNKEQVFYLLEISMD